MADFIVGALLVFVILGACVFIYKNKKKGKNCCGCAYSSTCGKKDGCSDFCKK